MEYAGIDFETFFWDVDLETWFDGLREQGVLANAQDYEPSVGDIVFFQNEEEEIERAGIVSEIVLKDGALYGIQVIEGDMEDEVQETEYALDDESLAYFGILPVTLEMASYADEEEEDMVIFQLQESMLNQLDGMSLAITGRYTRNALSATRLSDTTMASFDSSTGVLAEHLIWTFHKQNGDGKYTVSATVNGQQVWLAMSADNLRTVTNQRNASTFTLTFKQGIWYLNANSVYLHLSSEDAVNSYFSTSGNTGSWEMLRLYGWQKKSDYAAANTFATSSTTINLFDYWLQERVVENDYISSLDNNLMESGINQGEVLKFIDGNELVGKEEYGRCNWNETNGNYGRGIVASQLVDGYPVLAGTSNVLYSKDSLDYLFDPEVEHAGKISFTNVQGLLYNENGYLTYNSRDKYAEFDEETNSFTLYEPDGVYQGYAADYRGQFFPFNDYALINQDRSTDPGLNHYFGLSMTTRFIQRYQGHTMSTDLPQSQETEFYFSGDDDVWIYIDGILVADLGGVHSRIGVKINFATGSITYYDGDDAERNLTDVPSTIKEAYEKAGVAQNYNWSGNTFADNTTHTLKFFYMERGNWDSNMSLRFNLSEIPTTSIYKVDQYGNTLQGAVFSAYTASEDYLYLADNGSYIDLSGTDFTVDTATGVISVAGTTITPRYKGSTDGNGEMIFEDSRGTPYTLEEIEMTLGDHFILRETVIPDGYRTVASTNEIKLAVKSGMLICENVYESGSWAVPNALVVAPNVVYNSTANAAGTYDTATIYDAASGQTTGTLFAVVLARSGASLDTIGDVGSWFPVSGNEIDGFTIWKNDGETGLSTEQNITRAISAAQTYGTGHVFSPSASGLQVLIEEMPGHPESYWTYIYESDISVDSIEDMLGREDVEYYLAYYYTTADSLDGASTSNTWRVWSRQDAITQNGYQPFSVSWGSTIEIPNIENRLFFQKVDEEETDLYLNNAVFAMYAADEVNGTAVFVCDDGSRVQLIPDSDCASTGTAVFTDGRRGTYTIQNDFSANSVNYETDLGYLSTSVAGIVTITVDGSTVTITPTTKADGTSLVGYTHNKCEYVSQDGTGHFGLLKNGKYILLEIGAPNGYSINSTQTLIYVDSSGVYANAGTETDGVDVGNGAGYLVSTMDMFASADTINDTLRWVSGILTVNSASGYAGAFESGTSGWSYVTRANSSLAYGYGDGTGTKAKAMRIYLEYAKKSDPSQSRIFSYANNMAQTAVQANAQPGLELYTKSGWSTLVLFQDTDYGCSHTQNPTTYTDLSQIGRSTAGNILYLFSGSTFVIYKDEVIADLTVQKTDEEDTVLAGAGFVLYKEENGTKYYWKDEEWVELDESQKETDVMLVSSEDNGSLTFSSIPEGTYYLKEVQVPESENDEYHYQQLDLLTVTVGKKITQDGTVYLEVSDGTAYEVQSDNSYNSWYDPESSSFQYYFNAVNKKIPYVSLTIQKIDGSSRTSPTELADAKFVLVKKEDDQELYYHSEIENGKLQVTWTEAPEDADIKISDEDGNLNFSRLEDGTYYLRETAAPTGYKLYEGDVAVYITDGTASIEADNSIAYFNENVLYFKNYPGTFLPESSGYGQSGWYLIAAAVFFVLVFGYGWFLYRKKKAGSCHSS